MEKKGSILMERYELGKLLGQGNFAKVYYAKDIKTGQHVAIKVIDKEKTLKAGLNEQIKREISVMKLVKHENVLQLFEVMATKSKIYIVLEYAKGGELFNKVAKGRLKEDIARWIFQQLISAVDCCHSRGVYHRDLKLENLLIDEDGSLKVSDFGLSALSDSKRQDGLLHTMCGTPAYVAPEVINRRGYDGAKADIWSCGVILYVLLAGHLPFQNSNLIEMYKKITRADYRCPNWFPSEVRRLLLKILDPNPNTRIPISKIMENSWFKKGLGTRPVKLAKPETKENKHLEAKTFDKMPEFVKPSNLNAFDIISLSSGLDLSGLFVGDDRREDVRFTSLQPANVIVSKLEEVAMKSKLKITKKDGGFFRLVGAGVRKEEIAIDVEILEVTPSFHVIEMKRVYGNTMEYQKVLKVEIQPSLKDIVWAWQGDNHVPNGINVF
ncbi:CBL-interacting protein kinase 2-like [Amaranthus tricolor]|uniref:CBL-interacting protein kinase 2-like n=1 Tax=Amaranthus tricolor TaxID=29722 RepID=UPI0025858187|nr:CBL-interacting protein kinase 2-like [Amaranthus tricolor]